MALIKCKECGKEISSNAKQCPNCGAPKPKQTSFVTWVVAGFIGLLVISGVCSSIFDKKTTPKTQERPTVYLNEPLNIGNFTIKITKVTETKTLGNYKAPMFLKLYAEIKNNGAEGLGLQSFLESKKGKEFNCAVDEMAIIDDVKGAIDTKEYFKAGETKKGFVPFYCAAYLQGTQFKERNSSPSDYTMLVWKKGGDNIGQIILTARPQ